MNAELTIIYERGEDGWWVATIPEVPGAFSQGKTQKRARENALDALQELMAARRDVAMRDRAEATITERLVLAG